MLPSLSIHTITNKPWSVEQCIEKYAAAGVGGITLWRYNFEGRDPAAVGHMIREAGLTCTGLARGGFFPGTTAEARRAAIEDNRRAIDEAAACGAPLLVLVCGSVPGQALDISRGQITDGIAADISIVKENWTKQVSILLSEATLIIPKTNNFLRRGSRTGNHTEHLGYILAEMQFLPRAYPGAKW